MGFGLFATVSKLVVHDWTLKSGDWEFGIRELAFGKLASDWPGDFQSTSIYFGKATFETNLSACACLAIATVAVVCLMSALSVIIARVSRTPAAEG